MGANQNVIIQGLDELPTNHSVHCEINLIIFEYIFIYSRNIICQMLNRASLAHINQSDWQQAFSFLLFGR